MRASPGRDRWIPLSFVAAMGLVVAVNAAMVTIALRTDNGLTRDDPFARGLAYNRVLAEAERQGATGWQFDVALRPAGAGTARLTVRATDRAGLPLETARVEGELVWPIEKRDAVPVSLGEGEPGFYAATVALPRRGQWDVHLVVRRAGETVELRQRAVVP